MGRTQDIVAYDFNAKLLSAKQKALDTLSNVLDKAEAKGADPKVIAQVRMAATAILRTRREQVGYHYTQERLKAEEVPSPDAPRPEAPPSPPTSMQPTPPRVPLADEVGTRSVKWLQRELKRAGLASLPSLSLESG